MAKCVEERQQAEALKRGAKQALYQSIVSRDEMAMAVSVAYQRAEEERMDQLHSCLQRVVHVERERIKVADRALQALQEQMDRTNRSEDIQLLIHVRNTQTHTISSPY